MPEEEVQSIRGADLLRLMDVVEAATGLYNACEQTFGERWGCAEFKELGEKLRAFGLQEVSGE